MDEIKISGIPVTLPCGHVVPYEKRLDPCVSCKSVEIIPEVSEANEDSKVRLQLFTLLQRENFHIKPFLHIDQGGKLHLDIVEDRRGRKNIELTSLSTSQVCTMIKIIGDGYDSLKELADNNKSLVKIIFDPSYRAKYFDIFNNIIGLSTWEKIKHSKVYKALFLSSIGFTAVTGLLLTLL